MKTIITGGSSGIGLKLCEELLNESKVNKVFVVDTKRPPKKIILLKIITLNFSNVIFQVGKNQKKYLKN